MLRHALFTQRLLNRGYNPELLASIFAKCENRANLLHKIENKNNATKPLNNRIILPLHDYKHCYPQLNWNKIITLDRQITSSNAFITHRLDNIIVVGKRNEPNIGHMITKSNT